MILKKIAAAVSLAALGSAPAIAQESNLDVGRFAVAGYGDISYADIDGVNTNVESRFVPIFLFQLSEKLHIESELEFGLNEEGEAETELEYADIHYFLNDNTIITAGKFLLPFGSFGPNIHPSWINKLPDMPAVYGHDGNGMFTPLLPVLSDTGVSVRNVFQVGKGKLMTDFYVVSGPKAHEEEPADPNAPAGAEEEFPEVEFETGVGDNNNDSAMGGRIAYGILPNFEVGYSFYNGAYDEEGKLDFSASAIDFSWNSTYANIRGEIITTEADEETDTGEIETLKRDGWYLQGSWRLQQLQQEALNPVELVARYSKINKFEAGKRWTLGLNYWLEPSAVLKFSYQKSELDEGESDNRLFMQLAFGF